MLKKSLLVRFISILTLICLSVGIMPVGLAEAKEITIAVPKITVRTINDGLGIEVIVSKTKDADGYRIYVYNDGNIYSGYRNKSYGWIGTIEQNGTKKRSYTIKNLPAGNYEIVVQSYNKKKYGTEKLSEYSESKYITIEESRGGYKTNYDFSKVKKGDVVKFGAYEQDGDFTNGKEPIEWVVLKKNKKSLFVVSKYVLDCIPYYTYVYNNVTWESSPLREWLNKYFYNIAFNDSEKRMIQTKVVENYDNPVSGGAGGDDTLDKVFLMSQLECIETEYGFNESFDESDKQRRAAPTYYADYNGAVCSDFYRTIDNKESCWWWLRSPGEYQNTIAVVYSDGSIGSMQQSGPTSIYVEDDGGVRPAMYIDLTSIKSDEAKDVIGYKTSYDFSDASEGDIIRFGSYEQNYPANGEDPIEWIVLDRKSDGLLLLSNYALDCKPFGDDNYAWYNCRLREWLNNDFYNIAFNKTEKTMIKYTLLKSEDNLNIDTCDKVFLLSETDIWSNPSIGRCEPTEYAVAQGSFQSEENSCCVWWLRSPGIDYDRATDISAFGDIYREDYAYCIDVSVRPAIFISFNDKPKKKG